MQTNGEEEEERPMELKETGAHKEKQTNAPILFLFFFFLRQTQTFSTDVLQHEYRIYIFIYFIHTFSKLDQNFVTGR